MVHVHRQAPTGLGPQADPGKMARDAGQTVAVQRIHLGTVHHLVVGETVVREGVRAEDLESGDRSRGEPELEAVVVGLADIPEIGPAADLLVLHDGVADTPEEASNRVLQPAAEPTTGADLVVPGALWAQLIVEPRAPVRPIRQLGRRGRLERTGDVGVRNQPFCDEVAQAQVPVPRAQVAAPAVGTDMVVDGEGDAIVARAGRGQEP